LTRATAAVGLLAALAAVHPGMAQDLSDQRNNQVKIRIATADSAMTATLDNSETVHDFLALLPLTTTLDDYASTEKVAELPKRLRTNDTPAGIDPAVGDVTYYAPWGNLAIFYRDFGYARGLVKLGTIDAGIEALARPGSIKVTIERLPE
jgi:hypothetical protein